MLLLNGCSFTFKYIDPQYYEFKRLCKDIVSKVEVYNQDYWEIIKNHNNINTNTRGCFYHEKLEREICFGSFKCESYTECKKGRLNRILIKRYYNNIHYATQIGYSYKYCRLCLKGDEAAGWHWETEDTLICEDLKDKK